MNAQSRFSNRVQNYILYRPDYPAAIVDFLESENVLAENAVIADIGSGTGISSELFLKKGYSVFGVEPNKEMREAAEKLLNKYESFTSVPASAEASLLETASVDLIAAGQAFHWFHKTKAGSEFRRILKPDGYAVLMWNDRKTDTTPFLREYEEFLRQYSTDYLQVDHKNIDGEVLSDFFSGVYSEKVFDNCQQFDLNGLRGRVLSSSYMPSEDHKNYGRMNSALQELFEKHNDGGLVNIDYDTRIYYGKLHK
jgi:SAM-dependent methyltransferase